MRCVFAGVFGGRAITRTKSIRRPCAEVSRCAASDKGYPTTGPTPAGVCVYAMTSGGVRLDSPASTARGSHPRISDRGTETPSNISSEVLPTLERGVAHPGSIHFSTTLRRSTSPTRQCRGDEKGYGGGPRAGSQTGKERRREGERKRWQPTRRNGFREDACGGAIF